MKTRIYAAPAVKGLNYSATFIKHEKHVHDQGQEDYYVLLPTTRFLHSPLGLGGLKETKMFLPHPRVKVSIVGSLRDREVACSASDRQGSNFESCVWRTMSSQSSHHPQ